MDEKSAFYTDLVAKMMQGLLARHGGVASPKKGAKMAAEYADAVLKELEDRGFDDWRGPIQPPDAQQGVTDETCDRLAKLFIAGLWEKLDQEGRDRCRLAIRAVLHFNEDTGSERM